VLSIIVPTYQEAGGIATCLTALNAQAGPFEVFVVDGGSKDGTLDTVRDATVNYPLAWGVAPQRGRSAQMNWGAAQTGGEVLLFLHADSCLPVGGLALLQETMRGDWVGGRFDVQLDDPTWPYPWMGRLINWRSRLARRCTGDMGIFVRRSVFTDLGGFPDQPLMEDLEFSARLYRLGTMAHLALPLQTSARRWQKSGILKTFWLMQTLRVAYALGTPPATLQRWYRDVR